MPFPPSVTGSKLFRVASVSNNTNSFGLRGVILIAPDGEAWEVACSNPPARLDTLTVPTSNNYPQWHQLSLRYFFEIPRRLPDAPRDVVVELWSA